MGITTKISWADHTFNPWLGCTKIGPGCDNCYAEVQDSRMRWEGKKHWGAGVPRYLTSASNWAQPLAWNRAAAKDGKPHRTFCASLADVFDNEVPHAWRENLWKLVSVTPHLSWLLVTKRIGNVARMVPSLDWLAMHDNVRILITVCNQEEADRDIQKLLALPCKNGVSYEPALGNIDWPFYGNVGKWRDRTPRIEWLIVGGESGSRARPFDVGWAHNAIEQCRAAGTACFIKQLGRRAQYNGSQGLFDYAFKDRAGADPAEWPEDLNVREYPA